MMKTRELINKSAIINIGIVVLVIVIIGFLYKNKSSNKLIVHNAPENIVVETIIEDSSSVEEEVVVSYEEITVNDITIKEEKEEETIIFDSITIDQLLNEEYIDWYSTVSDRVNAPIFGLGDSTLFSDVFDVQGREDIVFYISYDPRYIPIDSEVAKVLYHEDYQNEQENDEKKVFRFSWNRDKQSFVYPSGVDAILLPGARISFNQETAKLKYLREVPYYQQASFSTSRLEKTSFEDGHNSANSNTIEEINQEKIFEQQKINFKTFFITKGDNYITPEGDVILSSGRTPISKLIKGPSLYGIIGLRSLGVKPKNGNPYKIVWNPYIDTYVYESGFEVSLKNGDKIAQLVEDTEFDIDALRSVGYVDYGNHVSGCVRTKRLNGYQFNISIPFGAGPYKTIYKNRSNLPGYLGASTDPINSATWFLTNRNSRWDMILDDSKFPEGTDFIEIIMHSDSPLGRIYGHAAIGVKYADKRWILDPYVRVPGYAEEEPKEINDRVESDRAVGHLGAAKVFYFNSDVDVVGIPRDQLDEFFDNID